jgi:hypothetical protein
MKRILLISARLLIATIVVMQKLASTASAAEKPRKSIQDIPLLPHSPFGRMSYRARCDRCRICLRGRADQRCWPINGCREPAKQRDYRAIESKESEPPSLEGDLVFRVSRSEAAFIADASGTANTKAQSQ